MDRTKVNAGTMECLRTIYYWCMKIHDEKCVLLEHMKIDDDKYESNISLLYLMETLFEILCILDEFRYDATNKFYYMIELYGTGLLYTSTSDTLLRLWHLIEILLEIIHIPDDFCYN